MSVIKAINYIQIRIFANLNPKDYNKLKWIGCPCIYCRSIYIYYKMYWNEFPRNLFGICGICFPTLMVVKPCEPGFWCGLCADLLFPLCAQLRTDRILENEYHKWKNPETDI